jgi:acetyltransferase-like isoleucine patch superfamily enzyme
MDVGAGCRIFGAAKLDKTNPRGVHIGKHTAVASRADVLAHDPALGRHVDTWIGDRCYIGEGAVIYSGVRVGDGSIVAPGAVVTRDVPAGCSVAGNPARVVEKGLRTQKYGVRIDAQRTQPLSPSSETEREGRAKMGAVS